MRVVTEEGHGWCRQHAPSFMKARSDAGHAAFQAEWAAKTLARELTDAKVKLADMVLSHESVVVPHAIALHMRVVRSIAKKQKLGKKL
jgi:hypothetical protein